MPSPLDTVIGHPFATASLRRQIGDGVLAHALLISGPDRVGKTTVALAAATELLGATDWPGGVAAHPDFWIDDSDAERIGIERVRAGGSTDEGLSLQDFLARRPYAGGRRVAVIGRADRLTEPAANCLLKTVEEPPPDTHILLATANLDGLPSTILSRCQMLTLAPVPASTIASWLVDQHGVASDLAASVASLGAGRPGRALRLATEPGALAAEMDALEGFLRAAGGGVGGALTAAAALAPPGGAEGREKALLQLGVWTGFLRDVVCVAEGAPELVMWSAYRPALEAWAAALSPGRASAMLGATMAAVADIAGNVQPRLCFEVLFIDFFGGLGGTATPPATSIPAREGGVVAAPGGALKSRATTAKRPTARKR